MKLYISTLAVWLLAIFYAPLVLFLIWKLWRRLKLSPVKRIAVCVGALLVAAAIPLWDVLITSYYMAQLCPQAGIVVHRSVTVDGFYTNSGSRDILEKGYKYVETVFAGSIRIYANADGVVREQQITDKSIPYTPKSRYEYIVERSQPLRNRLNIGVDISKVTDRQTTEELGRATRYVAYPGWLDRNTFALLGMILWMCPDDQLQDLRMRDQVLPPNK